MKDLLFNLIRISFLIPISSFFTWAQSPTATLTGTVTDPSAAAVSGARIHVRNESTGEVRQATTGPAGTYTLPNLSPGTYEVTFEFEGFSTLREKGVVLQVDQTARLDVRLSLGNVSESVQVSAQAPVLNTENASKGDVIANSEMNQMPLPERDFTDLAFLVANVGRSAESGLGSDFAVNGARTDNTNFIVDGFSNRSPRSAQIQARPPLEAMQEFKMQTSGYSAEYGKLGGGLINMVLKSGTNRVHGSAFEYLRNDLFDARNFFDTDKSRLRRNQFGASLDGPVILPHVYNGANRTFFLFSWESYRQRQGSNLLTRVPGTLERTGDYSGSSVTLTDPLGGKFPGNRIPASRIDSISNFVLPYYPLPNQPGQANNYRVNSANASDWDNYVAKLDQKLRGTDSLSFRFMRRHATGWNPFPGGDLPAFGSYQGGDDHLYGLNYTGVLRSNLIIEGRFGFTRTKPYNTTVNIGHDYAAEMGIRGVTSDPAAVGFPRFVVTNLVQIGDNFNYPNFTTINGFQYSGALTWVRGSHTLKAGAEVAHSQDFAPNYSRARGYFNFLGRWTGDAFADFLLGDLNNTIRQLGANQVYLFYNSAGAFVQDDYRLSQRVTLNLGARYELYIPMKEKYGRLANFVPELNKIVIASDNTLPNLQQLVTSAKLDGRVITAEQAGLPENLVNTLHRDFAPRVGIAVRATPKAVIRGGYGIYFTDSLTQTLRRDMNTVFPFALTQSTNRNTKDPNYLTLQNPFPAVSGGDAVTTALGFTANPAPQYLQSWNLTVERELGAGAAIEVAYLGSKGTHLLRRYDINQPVPVPGVGMSPRIYSGLNTIWYYATVSNSNYNAATATFRRRFSRGLMFRLNYTYGKSIDDASQLSNDTAGGLGSPQNSRNFQAERARSDWDVGHTFTSAFSYDLPLGRGRLRSGWQLAGTGRMYTGRPFTPRTTNTDTNAGEAVRPDRIAKGSLENPGPNRWFDTTAFPQVPLGGYRFGNSGRNVLDGPGFVSLNASLTKRVAVTEKTRLEFRWDAFNVTNRTNFSMPNNSVNDPAGATITNAAPSRFMQLSLRYAF